MSTSRGHHEWVNQSLRLSEEKKHDAFEALEDFFSCFHPQDMSKILWDWLIAAISSESCTYNTGFARNNLVFVYQKMLLLIEAAHEINKRRKKKEKWKRKRWPVQA
jgi:hypothetical protein